ncbi:MAG TPA: T9SS type A sorting domain-containing protein, partial [Pontibacter sp.]
TCAVTEVTLEGSSTTAGVTYSWSGPDGFTSSKATPTVNKPGTYTLTVTDPKTGASASDTVVVAQDIQKIELDILHDPGYDYITCKNKIVRLWAGPDRAGLNFEWTGPNGFTSDQEVITVSVLGTYTLTVTDPVTGCSATTSANVWAFYPTLTADAGPDKVLTCKDQKVILEGSISGTPFSHWYKDGEHVTFGSLSLEVNEPGTYVLKAIETTSGCIVTDTVVVTLDNQAPAISAQGGTLNSGTGTVQLTGSSTTEHVTYSWTGPNGYTSAEQNPVVNVAGDYTLTVTSEQNGCTATKTVTVNPSQAVANTEHSRQVRAYPNPVRGKATIEFKLGAKENYVVNLYDLKGNLIRELKKGSTRAGEAVSVEFDGTGLPDGLYFARIVSTSGSRTVKLILEK